MYKIKRFNKRYLRQVNFGITTKNVVGNWPILDDSEIYNGARRTNDPVLGKYNQEWIYGSTNEIEIIQSKYFKVDFNKKDRRGNYDILPFQRSLILRYIDDLKNGLISVDNPNIDPKYSDKTHFLKSLSINGEYMVYSKSITEYDKLVYKVYKPKFITLYHTKTLIELINCIGHRFNGKSYTRF